MSLQFGFSLATIPRYRATVAPQHPAFTFLFPDRPEVTMTNIQVYRASQGIAARLVTAGIQPGGLVILALDHSPVLVASFFGAIHMGAVPTISPYFTARTSLEAFTKRIVAFVRQTEAAALVTLPQVADAVRPALSEIGCQVIAIDLNQDLEVPDGTGPEPVEVNPEAIAYIQFSSGTTGFPKGVMLSHRALVTYTQSSPEAVVMGTDDVSVGWLPLYHDMGLVTQVITPLTRGFRSILISPTHWVADPKILFQSVHRFQGSMTWMPNFGFIHCVKRVSEADLDGLNLKSWRKIGNGAEPVKAEAMRSFAARFAPYGLSPNAPMVGYGLAENVIAVTITPDKCPVRIDCVSREQLLTAKRAVPVAAQSPDHIEIVSCGKPKPEIKLKIVSEDRQPLPERQVGEIAFSSDVLFGGYYRQPELTDEVVCDGWYYTGDLGYLADGELYHCGRKKDLIIAGGKNIQPHHLESVALDVLGTRSSLAVAFGIEHPDLGTEVPVLVCELREQIPESEHPQLREAIQLLVQQALDVALGDIRFVNRGWIVRTTSGKIARAANRDKYLTAGFSPSAGVPDQMLDDPNLTLVEQIARLFERVLGVTTVSETADFFDLGGDSLRFLDLCRVLERLVGQPIKLDLALHHSTPVGLAALVNRDPSIDASSGNAPATPTPYQQIAELLQTEVTSYYEEEDLKADGKHWLYPLVSRLSYHQAWRFVLWGTRLTVRRLPEYPQVVPGLRKFYALLDQPPCSEAEFIHQVFSLYQWKRGFRLGNIINRLEHEFDQVVVIEGEAHLQRAWARGTGVVLPVFHTPWIRLLPYILQRMKISPHTYIGHARGILKTLGINPQSPEISRIQQAIFIQQLNQCRQTLGQNGVVSLAADGLAGNSPIVKYPVLNRLRPFRTGFAHLAVTCESPVVPVYATVASDGRARIIFNEPLPETDATLSEADRISKLVEAYARFWDQVLRADPACLPINRIHKHLTYPEAVG